MVKVHFHDGSDEVFPNATGATNRGPLFTVHRYDTAARNNVEVRTFPTETVAYALVDERGVERYVGGSARST
jgi:hypothetical protein